MSNDEAEALMDNFDRWNAKEAKRSFIHRMEKKLGRKERYSRR